MKRENFVVLGMLVVLSAFSFIFCTCLSTIDERFSGPEEWDIVSLDTARNEPVPDYVKNFVLELNKVRSDPQKYAAYHRNDMSRSLYNYLKNLESLEPLLYNNGLTKAANELFSAHMGESGVVYSANFITNIIYKYVGPGGWWAIGNGYIKPSILSYIDASYRVDKKLSCSDPEYKYIGIYTGYCTRERADRIYFVYASSVNQ